MARLDEIGESIAALLASGSAPEPLPMTFRGHSPAEIAFLVRSVVTSAERNGHSLGHASVPQAVARLLQGDPDARWTLPLSSDVDDDAAVAFWLFPPA